MLFSVEQIAASIQVINKYAKTDGEFYDFYHLKDEILKKLISKGQAKKIGLDNYNVRNGESHVLTSVQVGSFYFHTTPTDEDLKKLQILKLRKRLRNPNVHMDIKVARYIIHTYLINHSQNELNTSYKPTQKIQPYQTKTAPSNKSRVSNEMRGTSQWFL